MHSRLPHRKILPASLHQLQTLTLSQPYQLNFQYISFVARLVSLQQGCLFSDQTGCFQHQLKRTISSQGLSVGKYYECLGKVVNMGTGLRVEVMNLREVQGNFVTIHMARVIKYHIEVRDMLGRQQTGATAQEANTHVQDSGEDIRRWIQSNPEFRLEEIRGQFGSEENIRSVIAKMEDEGVLGNMGDHYQYLD